MYKRVTHSIYELNREQGCKIEGFNEAPFMKMFWRKLKIMATLAHPLQLVVLDQTMHKTDTLNMFSHWEFN